MNNKVSITSILRTDKPISKEGTFPVHFLVRVNGKSFKVSAKVNIEEKYWDSKRGGIVINRYSIQEHREIAAQLTTAINDFYAYIGNLEFNGKTVTAETAKEYFKKPQKKGFYEYFQEKIELRAPKLDKATIQKYKETLAILQSFKPHLEFEDIDKTFIAKFENYLRTERNNGDGGVFNRLKNLRSILKEAFEEELINRNPFAKYKIKQPKDREIYLEKTEIEQLKGLAINPEKRRLNLSRDLYVFSCFTGLRFSDVRSLSKSEIDWKTKQIVKVQEKTRTVVKIPLTKTAIALIRKYQEDCRSNIFPRITNQEVNRDLKELGKAIHIDRDICFHTSRHTFGTRLVELKTPINVVKDMMGHKKITDTMRYAKSTQALMKESIEQLDL